MEATVHDIYFNTHRQFKAKSEPVTDEELLLKYRETGDRELYASLVYRYERELFAYLRRYLGNAEMAEDVFQQAFLQVHLKSHLFDASRRFRPWLYTIATNAAIDAKRRNKKHTKLSLDAARESDNQDVGRLINLLESSDPDPSNSALMSERSRLVRKALSTLPESMNVVIHLVYYQGMKYREAAEVLDVPVGTVKSRLHSAISKLTDVWNTSNVE